MTKSQIKNIPSVVLTPEEHQAITTLWRNYIAYNGSIVSPNTSTASLDNIRYAVQQIYSSFPELLNASIRFLDNLR